MGSWKTRWWLTAAPLISLVTLIGSVGNLVSEDGGPFFGMAVYLIAAAVGAALVVAGLLMRQDGRRLGSVLIASGVVPGFPLVAFFWFPPVAMVGVVAMAVCLYAAIDYSHRAATSETTS
jgi:hypothetical protein